MKGSTRVTFLIISTAVMVGLQASFPTRAIGVSGVGSAHRPWPKSCSQPATKDAGFCDWIASQLLARTIRFEMEGFVTFGGHRKALDRSGKSHATILDERHIITHNHFPYKLTEMAPPDGAGFTGFRVRRADGTLLAENLSLSSLTIVYEDEETLILELTDASGRGLLEVLGIATTKPLPTSSILLQPGMEVAQVDWDGLTAHIDWILVEVTMVRSLPYVEVANFVEVGASGGGVFWQGQHIGNNWSRNTLNNESGRQFTKVALNQVDFDQMFQ